MNETDPKVFIHYSWDDENHKRWTLFLADRLISDGVEVYFDRYDLKLGSNNNYFMEKISKADKVLLIMTPEYKDKADERKSGVGYEYQIISTEFSKNISSNEKFIPILRIGQSSDSIPAFLQGFLFLNMTNDKEFEHRYLELLKNIYNEPLIQKPAKGKRPNFKSLEKNLQKVEETNSTDYGKVLTLGITKRQTHKILGEPQEANQLAETYWSHGLQVYYNRHWDKVDGVLAKRQPSGIIFEGEICGVKLGDSFAEVKSKLGNPINWGLPDPYTSFAFYKLEDKFLTIALWRDNPEAEYVDFKLGTVYAIGYSEAHSFLACEAIVSVTIEQIRQGKKLSYLERRPKGYDFDFSADFLREKYIMLPTQFGMFGGYFVTVFFEESKKLVDFWLYDLAWTYLVIRIIAVRKDDETESESETEEKNIT
jgi:hypothetical protein